MEQRLRSQYDITATPINSRIFPISCANRNWSAWALGDYYLNGTSKVMLDYVIPRFKARQKAGEKFFNDMQKDEVTVSTSGSGGLFTTIANACTSPNIKAMTEVSAGWVGALTPRSVANSRGHKFPLQIESLNASEIARAQRAVSTEVLAKIGTGSAEMWESVAQYGQTLDLLRNPLRRIQELSSRLLNSASRGNASRQLLSEVSGGYLLYRYGILPAMKDIENILSSLTKEAGQMEKTSRAKEQLSADSIASGVTVTSAINAGWHRQSADVVTIRGMHLDKGYVSFANTLGFDFKGLLLLPVQLTSYSFVADWFYNLSSYIKATIPAFGWTPIGGCLVTTRVTSSAYTLTSIVNNLPGTNVITTAPSGSAAIITQSVTRQPLLPASFERQSDFKFDKFTRVADALSLVANRLVKVNTLVGPQPNFSAFHNKKAYSRWASQPGVL
jgi:hypothetical protein